MKPAGPDTDDTVRLPRRSKRAVWPLVGAAVITLALGGSAAVWLLRPEPALKAVVATAPVASPAPTIPRFEIITASEQQIVEHVPLSLTVFRFADNPQIVVLDFASLTEQGTMLNRVAAFTEKAGLPHDRVLTESELETAISDRGDTVETFYFGHDYAAAALAHFFALADRQGIELNTRKRSCGRCCGRKDGWRPT